MFFRAPETPHATRGTWRPWLQLGSLLLAVWAQACAPRYPNCNNDDHCRERTEYCVNQRCQQCREDSHCGANRRCVNNRCELQPGRCEQNGDCPDGQSCENNRCAPRTECDQNRACPNNGRCENGRCAANNDEDPTDNRGRLCTFQPVYFSFDNNALDEAARRTLQEASSCLQRERDSRYVLIGRADPRGTTEYNLALGERRARAVQNYLIGLGIEATRVVVSSEGSEAATGTDEASWARDRRVDFRPRN